MTFTAPKRNGLAWTTCWRVSRKSGAPNYSTRVSQRCCAASMSDQKNSVECYPIRGQIDQALLFSTIRGLIRDESSATLPFRAREGLPVTRPQSAGIVRYDSQFSVSHKWQPPLCTRHTAGTLPSAAAVFLRQSAGGTLGWPKSPVLTERSNGGSLRTVIPG